MGQGGDHSGQPFPALGATGFARLTQTPTDKVFKAQKARDETSLGSRSLFAPASGSAPLPNRRPTGQQSKTILTQEELNAIPPFRGEEKSVEQRYSDLARHWEGLAKAEQFKKGVVKTINTGDGTLTEYKNGATIWLAANDPLAGIGLEALNTP